MTTRLPILPPDSPLVFTGLTNREQHRVADRAYRRAHYTGLPLSQMLRSETARFERKHPQRFLGADMAASHQNTAEIHTGDFERGAATFDQVKDTMDKTPGHEAADTVSSLPSPIPEEKEAAEAAMPDGLPASKVGGSKAKKPKAESAPPADVQTNPVVSNDVSPEAAALAQEKRANIGKRVTWKMVGKDFAGEISHVIPAGATPKSLGIEAGNDKVRTDYSYVVKVDGTGKLSWPVRSTLTLVE